MNNHELSALQSHHARLKTKEEDLAAQITRFNQLYAELQKIGAEFKRELDSDPHLKSHFFYIDLLSHRALLDRVEVHQQLVSKITQTEQQIHENYP